MKKMQNLTKITLKPLLHQLENSNFLLSIEKMTKYTYTVILNVALMIHNNIGNVKKNLYAHLQTLVFKTESYHPKH